MMKDTSGIFHIIIKNDHHYQIDHYTAIYQCGTSRFQVITAISDHFMKFCEVLCYQKKKKGGRAECEDDKLQGYSSLTTWTPNDFLSFISKYKVGHKQTHLGIIIVVFCTLVFNPVMLRVSDYPLLDQCGVFFILTFLHVFICLNNQTVGNKLPKGSYVATMIRIKTQICKLFNKHSSLFCFFKSVF